MKQRETLIRKIIPVELFDMAGWSTGCPTWRPRPPPGKAEPRHRPVPPGRAGPRVRFGLEITGVSDIDRERNAAYQEAGWTYVTTLRNLYYVYRTERVDAAPPHRPGAPEPAVERVGCNHSPTAAQPQTAFLFLPVYSAPHHRPFAQHWRYH